MSLKLTFYGHATCAFALDDIHVVVDPFFAPKNPAASVRAEDVSAQFILQTHGHGDHIGDTVALAKRTGATVICVPEIARLAGQAGR